MKHEYYRDFSYLHGKTRDTIAIPTSVTVSCVGKDLGDFLGMVESDMYCAGLILISKRVTGKKTVMVFERNPRFSKYYKDT